jgi:hypothetical protein
VGIRFGVDPINSFNFLDAWSLFAAAMLHNATDENSLAEIEFIDHGAGDKRIASFPLVVVVGVSEETIAIRVHFQHATTRLIWQGFAILLGFMIAAGTLAPADSIPAASPPTGSISA